MTIQSKCPRGCLFNPSTRLYIEALISIVGPFLFTCWEMEVSNSSKWKVCSHKNLKKKKKECSRQGERTEETHSVLKICMKHLKSVVLCELVKENVETIYKCLL